MRPLRTLLAVSVLARVAVCALVLVSARLLPLFDGSPACTGSPSPSVLLRWDAFHFAHIAAHGFVYEHEWAFLGGVPRLMRLAALGSDRWAALLAGGASLAILCDSTRVLYRLSLHHLRSPALALVSAALSVFSSSPVALRFAPYSEPFFTYLSYRGMLACARSQWAAASLCFALASCFRSNGVFLSGFILWGMLIAPFLTGRNNLPTPTRLLKCVLLTAFPLVPFVRHNFNAYVLFCTPSATHIPDWCSNTLPLIYSHVQAKYWNVGFLRYWTVSNIPNFILALPPLLHLSAFCWFYLSNSLLAVPSNQSLHKHNLDSPFLSPCLLPHVLHASALVLILVFDAHVQISLRLLPSLPLTYWAAARLMLDRPRWGKAWVVWSVLWGAASCVLWAVFLPPA